MRLKPSIQGHSVRVDNMTVSVSKVDVEIPLEFCQLEVRSVHNLLKYNVVIQLCVPIGRCSC